MRPQAKSWRQISVVALLLFGGAWLMLAQSKARPAKAPSGVPNKAVIQSASALGDLTARLPLAFEFNAGQTDSRVKFLSRQAAGDLLLLPSEAVMRFRDARAPLRMKFAGANRDPK